MDHIPAGIWLVLELVVGCAGGWNVWQFIKAYRTADKGQSVEQRIEEMVARLVKSRLVGAFLTRDLLMVYYLFSKSKQPSEEHAQVFTVHQKIGYGGIVFGFIFVLVLEGAGLSYFLHGWNKAIAWIHLVLSIYMILFLISDYKAVKRNPIRVSPDQLQFRLGLWGKLDIPLTNIDHIQTGKTHFEADQKRKDVWMAALIGFDEPELEMVFKEPVVFKNGMGRDVLIKKVYLTVDDSHAFIEAVLENQSACEVG